MNPAFHELIMDNPEIVQEIVEGINEIGEDEIADLANGEYFVDGEDIGGEGDADDDGEWEDIDEDGNPVQLDNNRKFSKFILKAC
jgi:hypothetical protein